LTPSLSMFPYMDILLPHKVSATSKQMKPFDYRLGTIVKCLNSNTTN